MHEQAAPSRVRVSGPLDAYPAGTLGRSVEAGLFVEVRGSGHLQLMARLSRWLGRHCWDHEANWTVAWRSRFRGARRASGRVHRCP